MRPYPALLLFVLILPLFADDSWHLLLEDETSIVAAEEESLQNALLLLRSEKPENAIPLLTSAAEGGNAVAQFSLGTCFFQGLGVEKDPAAGREWFEKAAAQNHGGALYCLALLQLEEAEGEEEQRAAMATLRQSSDTGYARAMEQLGFALLEGAPGVSRDENEGWALIEKAAVSERPQAQFEWARELLRRNEDRPEDALPFFQQAAAQGHGPSLNQIAAFHERGLAGLEKSPEQAFQNYLAAAKTGVPEALYNVSAYYENGVVVDQDLDRASEWLLESAKRGFALAENKLGQHYLSGRGLPRDPIAASAWFQRAVQHGSADAHLNLAGMLLGDFGIGQNPGQAFQLIARAAVAGHSPAEADLASLLAKGVGTEADPLRAHIIASANAEEEWAKSLLESLPEIPQDEAYTTLQKAWENDRQAFLP